MKAIITQASEVEINGTQSVTYDILDDEGEVLTSSSISGDVDTLKDQISSSVKEYEAKCKSKNRLKEGDEIE